MTICHFKAVSFCVDFTMIFTTENQTQKSKYDT